MLVSQLQAASATHSTPLPLPSQLDALQAYLELLERWNTKMDLVAPAATEALIQRHLVDCYIAGSLAFSEMKLARGSSVMDIGSGAGLPGVVFALLWPEYAYLLCEPRQKRCFFLKEALRELGIENVRVIQERVEELELSEISAVTARAVGGQSFLLAQARRLSAPWVVELGGERDEVEDFVLVRERSYVLEGAQAAHFVRVWRRVSRETALSGV